MASRCSSCRASDRRVACNTHLPKGPRKCSPFGTSTKNGQREAQKVERSIRSLSILESAPRFGRCCFFLSFFFRETKHPRFGSYCIVSRVFPGSCCLKGKPKEACWELFPFFRETKRSRKTIFLAMAPKSQKSNPKPTWTFIRYVLCLSANRAVFKGTWMRAFLAIAAASLCQK